MQIKCLQVSLFNTSVPKSVKTAFFFISQLFCRRITMILQLLLVLYVQFNSKSRIYSRCLSIAQANFDNLKSKKIAMIAKTMLKLGLGQP